MAETKEEIKEQPVEEPQAAPTKSAKDTYREGFAADYPDVDMEDEEAFYGQLNKNRERNKQTQADFDAMNNMMAENPNAGYFMNDLFSGKSGEDLTASFLENFGETFKAAIDDPSEENVKKFGEALKKNADKLKQDEEYQQQWAANDEASQQCIEDFKASKGLDDAGMEDIKERITNFVAKFASGIIDNDMLEAVYKLKNYDTDMAKAKENGAVEGRNTRIKEDLRKGKGDGVPLMQGGGSAKTEAPKKKNTMFDLAKAAR